MDEKAYKNLKKLAVELRDAENRRVVAKVGQVLGIWD